MIRISFAVVFALLTLNSVLVASDWSQWRGPLGNGIAPNAASASGALPPLEFGVSNRVTWETPISGRGHGSPTIVGDRIFLATSNEATKTQSVMALDRSTGALLWKTAAYNNVAFPQIHAKNTHASATVASDGNHAVITFYSEALIRIACLSVEGKLIWKKELGKFKPKYPFGYAASPLIYQGNVIATLESEAETALVALQLKTGKEIWRTSRPNNSSYSSPALLKVGGRLQLCLSGGREICSYDPSSGKLLWQTPGAAKHTAGTCVGAGNFVLASGGYPQSETTCVRADGSGVVWKNKQKCYEQSMLVDDGYVYAVNDGGVAFCWDLETGKERWKKRLSGPISASPVLVGDRIYAGNEKGKIFVFRADPQRFEMLAENQLGDELFATPTFLDGQIYARVAFRGDSRQEKLYRFDAD